MTGKRMMRVILLFGIVMACFAAMPLAAGAVYVGDEYAIGDKMSFYPPVPTAGV